MSIRGRAVVSLWLLLATACSSPDVVKYTEVAAPDYYTSTSSESKSITLFVMLGVGDHLVTAEVVSQGEADVVVKVMVVRSGENSVDSGEWVKPELDLDDELGSRTVRDISGKEVSPAPAALE